MFEGLNQKDIKQSNRALVLKLICTGQHLSRIEISRLTGLSKMTVSNIAARFIQEGLIKEGYPSENQEGAGRKSIVLLPRDDSVFVAGVYIARDYVKVSLLSISARIMKIVSEPLSDADTGDSLLQKVLSGVRQITEGLPDDRVLGVGIACIGPLDLEKGVILSPPDFYGISNVGIKQFLEEKTGFKVVISNDMQASALAEKLFGSRRALKNFIYLGITHGIGSGIVTSGELFRGETGCPGEIGHTTIDFNGPVCSCGNRGCLEAYASIPNIIREFKKRSAGGAPSSLRNKPEIQFRDIAGHAQDNGLCGSMINDMAGHIAAALVNAVNTLDLSTVILGHEGAFGGEYFAGLIEKQINDRILYKNSKHVSVLISRFGDESPVIGSGILMLDRLFSGTL